jgi:hypothetical protein
MGNPVLFLVYRKRLQPRGFKTCKRLQIKLYKKCAKAMIECYFPR